MFTRNTLPAACLALLVGHILVGYGAALAESPNLGKIASPEEIASWDIGIGPDGAGLPSGSGTPQQGEQVYLALELENVQITNYQLGVLDNDAATDDLSLSLNFEKYKTTFTAYSKEGKSEGKVEHEWKVEEGE